MFEYEIEEKFIQRLESIGYSYIEMKNYDHVLTNFRTQLAKFNAKKLEEKGHAILFSDAEFNRIMIHIDNHSVYESAKILLSASRLLHPMMKDNQQSSAVLQGKEPKSARPLNFYD